VQSRGGLNPTTCLMTRVFKACHSKRTQPSGALCLTVVVLSSSLMVVKRFIELSGCELGRESSAGHCADLESANDGLILFSSVMCCMRSSRPNEYQRVPKTPSYRYGAVRTRLVGFPTYSTRVSPFATWTRIDTLRSHTNRMLIVSRCDVL
jgi:hypothetical protein